MAKGTAATAATATPGVLQFRKTAGCRLGLIKGQSKLISAVGLLVFTVERREEEEEEEEEKVHTCLVEVRYTCVLIRTPIA